MGKPQSVCAKVAGDQISPMQKKIAISTRHEGDNHVPALAAHTTATVLLMPSLSMLIWAQMEMAD
jgi:hypothetical protein